MKEIRLFATCAFVLSVAVAVLFAAFSVLDGPVQDTSWL